MEILERQDAAELRIDPEQRVRIGTLGHREYAQRIAAQEQARGQVRMVVFLVAHLCGRTQLSAASHFSSQWMS